MAARSDVRLLVERDTPIERPRGQSAHFKRGEIRMFKTIKDKGGRRSTMDIGRKSVGAFVALGVLSVCWGHV